MNQEVDPRTIQCFAKLDKSASGVDFGSSGVSFPELDKNLA